MNYNLQSFNISSNSIQYLSKTHMYSWNKSKDISKKLTLDRIIKTKQI